MPRYVVERTCRDGLRIPVDNQRAQACLAVVENNATKGRVLGSLLCEPGPQQVLLRLRRPAPEAIRDVAGKNNLPVGSITLATVLK